LKFPNEPEISSKLAHLILNMLIKDPLKRYTLHDVRFHQWTTDEMTEIEREKWIDLSDPSHHSVRPVDVTEEDVREALSVIVIVFKGRVG
jgi:serine/threonine protein kinase